MCRMKTLGLKPDYLLIYLTYTFVASIRVSWSLSEAGGRGGVEWGRPASSFMGLSPSLPILSASAFLSLQSKLGASKGLLVLPPSAMEYHCNLLLSFPPPDLMLPVAPVSDVTALRQLSSSLMTSLDSHV